MEKIQGVAAFTAWKRRSLTWERQEDNFFGYSGIWATKFSTGFRSLSRLRRSWGVAPSVYPRRCGVPHYGIGRCYGTDSFLHPYECSVTFFISISELDTYHIFSRNLIVDLVVKLLLYPSFFLKSMFRAACLSCARVRDCQILVDRFIQCQNDG